MNFNGLRLTELRTSGMAPSLLYECRMSARIPLTADHVREMIEAYFAERQATLLPDGEGTKDGRRFSWCGDVLEFLTEGLAERLAGRGITFSKSFPGPFRLMDEDQSANGDHVRRFWTTVLDHGCPIARLCTSFCHRHDRIGLPHPPTITAYPPDYVEPEVRP
jgi:hypothetical protein